MTWERIVWASLMKLLPLQPRPRQEEEDGQKNEGRLYLALLFFTLNPMVPLTFPDPSAPPLYCPLSSQLIIIALEKNTADTA